jgi:uncharacterized protein YggE
MLHPGFTNCKAVYKVFTNRFLYVPVPFRQIWPNPIKNQIYKHMKHPTQALALFFILIFVSATSLSGQAAGNYRYGQENQYYSQEEYPPAITQITDDHTLIIDIHGLMNVKADAQMAIFNILQVAPTAREADSISGKRIAGFVKGLKGLGISDADIFIDFISQVPIFEYEVEKKLFSKSYVEIPKGIELQKNIHIVFRNGNLLDRIVSVAALNEIYDLVKVEYYPGNPDDAFRSLREKAISIAKEKLADYEKLGIELDTVYHILAENEAVTYPISRYSNYQGFSSSNLVEKGKSGVNQVRKPNTLFYNKIPYEQYDFVINPVLLEPAIQYTYNLKVKYIIREAQPRVEVKREKEFILITPEGKITPLKIEPVE